MGRFCVIDGVDALFSLSRGAFTVVEVDDYFQIESVSWHLAVWPNGRAYAANRQFGLLHRHLMKCPPNMVVDHINGDALDNRRSNLRICTQANNLRNRRACPKTSKYLGVSWDKRKQKWFSQLTHNKRRLLSKRCESEVAAAVAYDRVAAEVYGEFANLNFPATKK